MRNELIRFRDIRLTVIGCVYYIFLMGENNSHNSIRGRLGMQQTHIFRNDRSCCQCVCQILDYVLKLT